MRNGAPQGGFPVLTSRFMPQTANNNSLSATIAVEEQGDTKLFSIINEHFLENRRVVAQ